MPDFKGIENFHLVLAFIVPGLIIVYVRSRFITGRSPSQTENILSYVALSLLYYTLTIPFIVPALSVQDPWIARASIWVILTLFGPALFGLALGAIAQRGLGRWCASKLSLSSIHVIPAAWDWRFSSIAKDGMFVLVTLSDDRQIPGFFGPRSFASSDPTERDLYVEAEYDFDDDNGTWRPRPETTGIFIPGKEIKFIEFWEPVQ